MLIDVLSHGECRYDVERQRRHDAECTEIDDKAREQVGIA